MANLIVADPRNEVTMRHLFESIKNIDILIHFLNHVLTVKQDIKFKKVSFLTSLRLPHAEAENKEHIIKLLCVDEADEEYIVLIVFSRDKNIFAYRSYAYLLEAYVNQMPPEEAEANGYRLRRAFLLAISDETIFPDDQHYISDDVFTNTKTGERAEFLCFTVSTYVQLSNFKLSIDQLKTTTEKWCYFLNHATEANQLDLEKLFADDEIFRRAYEELDMDDRWSKEEIRRYELEMQIKSQQHVKDEENEEKNQS
jgi:hypothetical protein